MVFHLAYFFSSKEQRNAGLLVPGGILTSIGFILLFEEWSHWSYAAVTEPLYIFAVVIGLFELWFFGERNKGLLVPIFILSLIGFYLFFSAFFTLGEEQIWPVILIIIGIFVFFKGLKKNSHKTTKEKKNTY
ncbi:hypothetical protein LC087_02755 [Bacillus carboniphilus]|uniref:Permease n=1 Tax=Bacillus carboniphilus TaxID=86663 RepID=A0ABY9JUR8_9BACI|nr:hypothetical protein [Bacillus carboniphilus]WLR43144.1 hypothetical protein LC087_02755 [Bacillus carboniphilus]